MALLVAGTRTTEFVWNKAHYNQCSATNTPVLNAPNQWLTLSCYYVWRYKHDQVKGQLVTVAYPGILFRGGGSTNSVEDRGQRERRYGGGSPIVRGSGGSCNLVQEISFHIVKFS